METKLLCAQQSGALKEAAALLRRGQVVAMPTETVYGLAGDAGNSEAVQRIFAAKGRPQDNPLIVHINSEAMLRAVVADVPAIAGRLAKAFWPGPLTLVLPRGGAIAPAVSAGLGTVAVRWPAHPAAQGLIEAAGIPLAAPSANRSGSPSPTSAQHVLQDLQGRIPLVLDGGDCLVGIESTVLSVTGPPVILRPGFITKEDIEAELGMPVALAGALDRPLQQDEAAQSPGMKYKHYAPRAQITLVDAPTSAAFVEYVNSQAQAGGGLCALCYNEEKPLLQAPAVAYGSGADAASRAAGLFAALRSLDDDMKAQRVLARLPQRHGIELAVYNRLLRAAAFRVVRI